MFPNSRNTPKSTQPLAYDFKNSLFCSLMITQKDKRRLKLWLKTQTNHPTIWNNLLTIPHHCNNCPIIFPGSHGLKEL